MRTIKALPLAVLAAILTVALAVPAVASAAEWTKNGEPITQPQTIELDGPLRIGYWMTDAYECDVHATATLYPASEGGGGEIGEVEAEPGSCQGTTGYNNCKFEGASGPSWWMEPTSQKQVVNHNMIVRYEFGGCAADYTAALGEEILFNPDDPNGISYLEDFEGETTIYPGLWTTEGFGGKLAVTPAGVYGIDSNKVLSPEVSGEWAGKVLPESAELHATVDPNGEGTYQFEYGKTTSYGSKAPSSPKSLTGTSPVNVSQAITGLSANTTYHYRVVAKHVNGVTVQGKDQTFTTLEADTVTFSGSVELLDVSEGVSASFECDVSGKAKLGSGVSGSIVDFDYDLESCVGGGYLAGCGADEIQVSTPWTIDATDTKHVTIDGFDAMVVTNGSECSSDEFSTSGDITLTPDNVNSMSSWSLSGEQTALAFGLELPSNPSASLTLAPAAYYGITG